MNLVIVTLDTTRADHLGAYGYFRDTSPAFDALAVESVFFERAVVPMATTLPTHLSLLTSRYPLEHGVLANTTQGGQRFVPAAQLRSFASVARDAGYRTGGFVSAAPLKRGSGIEVGFDTFDQPSGKDHSGRLTTERALAWLRENAESPVFLWVHYYDAHWPFVPPPEFRGLYGNDAALEEYIRMRQIADRAERPLAGTVDETRTAINLYDAEIRFQDTLLERVLNEFRTLDLWDRTAVLVVADHGEGLGQHGVAAHGGTWDEQLHAPMIMRVPGVAPQKVSSVVSIVDALPTFLGLVDEPALAGFREHASGHDVLAEGWEVQPVISQDTGRKIGEPGYRHSLTLDRWKYIAVEGENGVRLDRLFDLEADPFELRDLSKAEPETTAALRRGLEEHLEAQRSRGAALRGGQAPQTADADPELLEQLQALGYIEADPGAANSGAADGP